MNYVYLMDPNHAWAGMIFQVEKVTNDGRVYHLKYGTRQGVVNKKFVKDIHEVSSKEVIELRRNASESN